MFYQPHMRYSLYKANAEDWEGIALSRYNYVLLLEARVHYPEGLPVPAERCYWQYEYARTLFNQLKERGFTRLLFTGDLYDDLFQKFDEYEVG